MNKTNNCKIRSVAPKPIEYSYFCKFDRPVSVLVCPDKEMLRLSDLEDIDKEDSFEEWLKDYSAKHVRI